VILPDVRGLYRFYEELALRFAERGYTALAFDYFGRTAGARNVTTPSTGGRTSRR
jgi:carboxymethylenebutenolidase